LTVRREKATNMPYMESARSPARPSAIPTATWLRRFLVVLTLLGLTTLGGVLLWMVGLIAGPLSLLLLSALLAYILYPAVIRLQRHMPRVLAMLIVLVGSLVVLLAVGYGILSTIVDQLAELVATLQSLAQSKVPAWLQSLGIAPGRVQASEHQLAALLRASERSLGLLIGNVFVLALQSIVVAALLVYFLIYGPRALRWVRREAPLRSRQRVNFFLDSVDQVMGGFLRGAVFLACLMGAITGVGAFLMGIPFWLLIAVIVFICEFVPVIGAYISGFVGTLLALTQGWETALVYLAFATVLQGFLDAQVLIPRIIGKHTGVNPIIATFALLVGASLFGLFGAILAIPLVAVAQILLATAWRTYRIAHPEEFPDQGDSDAVRKMDGAEHTATADGTLPGVAGIAGG
jgi:predicted PurR-regulated permease PerM